MKLNIGIWVWNELGMSNIGTSLNNGHCTWLKVCVDWTIACHSIDSCICVSHTFSYLICLHDYADMEATNMTYGWLELEIAWLSFLLRLTWRSSLLCCNNGDAEILYSRWTKEVYDCSGSMKNIYNPSKWGFHYFELHNVRFLWRETFHCEGTKRIQSTNLACWGEN